MCMIIDIGLCVKSLNRRVYYNKQFIVLIIIDKNVSIMYNAMHKEVPYTMKLKDVILNYRRENKISQRELARRAGLSNSLISIIESGINPQTGKKMSQDIETYKKLADAMGMSLHELIDKIDDDEVVSLKPLCKELTVEPIVIPDSDGFRLIMENMSAEDYDLVMGAFARTEQRMRERGIIKCHGQNKK